MVPWKTQISGICLWINNNNTYIFYSAIPRWASSTCLSHVAHWMNSNELGQNIAYPQAVLWQFKRLRQIWHMPMNASPVALWIGWVSIVPIHKQSCGDFKTWNDGMPASEVSFGFKSPVILSIIRIYKIHTDWKPHGAWMIQHNFLINKKICGALKLIFSQLLLQLRAQWNFERLRWIHIHFAEYDALHWCEWQW